MCFCPAGKGAVKHCVYCEEKEYSQGEPPVLFIKIYCIVYEPAHQTCLISEHVIKQEIMPNPEEA